MNCPRCGAARANLDTECPACGVIYARFEAAQAQRAAAAAEAARRANIGALMNEGAEPEPERLPAEKKSRAWMWGFGLSTIFALLVVLGGAPERRPPAPTRPEPPPQAERHPQPIAREGQWFDLTGEAVIGCLIPEQLQRIVDLKKSGDMQASMRQLREYIDDEICVVLDTPMRVYVETTQGPYALVRKQGGTAAAWIVMPKR